MIFALRDAVVTQGRYPLLAGLTMQMATPSCLVLTGPNGAGKTSVLRLLAGLVPLARGEAEVLGIDIATADRRTLRQQVGWLGHEGAFYDDLTALENLQFAARATGVRADLEAALARVGLAEKAQVSTRALSAGQRRRLALAWLVARRPPLWLLDEPYASLDSDGRTFVDGLLRDAVDQGVAVVLTSHDELRSAPAGARELRLVGGRVAS
jgi:heme ABC exporter ATP-binding subunit CcmA